MKKTRKQTNGKGPSDKVYTTLDQIWGETNNGKYKTSNIEEYEKTIGEMNKMELWEHSVSVGESPVDNKDLLKKKLLTKFQQHNSKNRPLNVNKADIAKRNNVKSYSPEFLKILKEGK